MPIHCYTDRLSYQAGDDVAFHVSTTTPGVTLEIVRWGAERRVLLRQAGLTAGNHPAPENAYSHGCGWPAAFALTVPGEWPSGYYSVILANDASESCEHCFVVRSWRPGRDAQILLQLSTNTYQAYNTWGGASFYDGLHGPSPRVSFLRPFQPGLLTRFSDTPRMARLERAGLGFAGAGLHPARHYAETTSPGGVNDLSHDRRWPLSTGYDGWERHFVAWAERNGYRLDFAVNSDLEFHPEIVKGYRLVLSVGHDEYWSWGMRDTLEAYIANGGNVAFFSGNTCFWQVRWEENGAAMICYKYRSTEDPVYGGEQQRYLSSMWSDAAIDRPENQLTGVSFTRGGYARFGAAVPRGSGGYTIWRPDHWALAGTGLEYGDLLGAANVVVGYECDGCEFVLEHGLPVATHRDGTPPGFEILGTSPATLAERVDHYAEAEVLLGLEDLDFAAGRIYGSASAENKARLAHGQAVMGVYSNGGTVFTSGCTEWVFGLTGGDPLIERITRNVLDRLATAGQ